MVISGKHVGVVDPHNRCRSAAAGQAAGEKIKLKNLLKREGHASCFTGMFELTPTTTNYHATLFRFPLRKTTSEISSNLYTPEKIKENLFESFTVEAPLSLIFLKSVIKVSLYEYQDEPGKPMPVLSFLYGIETKENQSESLRSERRYCQEVAQGCSEKSEQGGVQVLTTTFVEKGPGGQLGREHNWLILNAIGSNNSELQSLGAELKVLPWVGLALPLPTEFALHDCHTSSLALYDAASLIQIISELRPVLEAARLSLSWRENSTAHTKGQAFCFLPLPGHISLPVHIHGYFAVSDNRRSIEWPQHDEKGARAQWNKLLLSQLVAPAYAVLLACRTLLLRYSDTPPFNDRTPGFLPDPFAAWPLLSEVKNQPIWSELLQPTLTLASNLPLLWTAACGGKWIAIDEAYYLPNRFRSELTSAPCPNSVADLLIEAQKPVVFLSKQVAETLSENNAIKLRNNEPHHHTKACQESHQGM